MRFPSRRPADSSLRPFVLIAEGNIQPTDKGLIAQVLGHFGLHGAKFLSPDEYAAYLKNLAPVAIKQVSNNESASTPAFKFNDLTSRDQFMVREHFVDYSRSYEDTLPLTSIGRLFNNLVDGEGPSYWHPSRTRRPGPEADTTEPMPPAGIILAKREEAGFPPINPSTVPSSYTKTPFCVPYAVQVGSFMDYVQQFAEHPRGFTKQEQLSIRMVRQLDAQIESAR